MQDRAVNSIAILCFLWVCMMCMPGHSYAQSRRALLRQLALTEKFIEENRSKQDMSFGEYEILREQLKIRQQLLYKLKGEINENLEEISRLDALICKMEEDIEAVKSNYSKTAKNTYLHFNQNNFWLSLFSSGSFSEAYYRLMYYRQFSNHRKQQIAVLQRTQSYLMQKSLILSEKNKRRRELIITQKKETKKIEETRKKQEHLHSNLESKYAAYKAQKEKKKKTVEAAINKSETSWKPVASSNLGNSDAFVRKRGQLDWPVKRSRCIIVGNYGKSEDSYGNPITNDGIFVRTQLEEPVKCVFGGTVTAVQNLPLGGKMVVIAHGKYRTTYSNVENVIVRKGESIEAGQRIGVTHTDSRTGESVLQFLIYKIPNTFLNPELWLSQFSRGEE